MPKIDSARHLLPIAISASLGFNMFAGCALDAASEPVDIPVSKAVEPLTGRVVNDLHKVGWSVSMDGNTACVGDMFADAQGIGHAGQTYVFIRAADGTWSQQATLEMSDPIENSFFGISCAVDANTIAVGATHGVDTMGNANSGAVYVYTRSGTTWTQQQKLSELDGGVFKSYGFSVSIDGEYLAVGSRYNDHSGLTDAGAVYAYSRTRGRWTLRNKLIAPTPNNYDVFGYASAMYGTLLVVGAYQHDNTAIGAADVGGVYVFRRTGSGSTTRFTYEATLTAPDGIEGDWLGYSVSTVGSTVVVAGMPGATRGGISQRGGFHTWRKGTSGWTSYGTKLASDAHAGDRLGDSIDAQSRLVVVGGSAATVSGLANAGDMYLFTGTYSSWTQSSKMIDPVPTSGKLFGYSVSVVGTAILASAPFPGGGASATTYAIETAP